MSDWQYLGIDECQQLTQDQLHDIYRSAPAGKFRYEYDSESKTLKIYSAESGPSGPDKK